MNKLLACFIALFLAGCSPDEVSQAPDTAHGAAAAKEEIVKGPHRGRLFVDGPLTLELAIFETGVPPEFRAWATVGGDPIPPDEVDLAVEVKRLGDVVDRYTFEPQGVASDAFLRARESVYEPHSFVVTINLEYAGQAHRWTYESFEGRTTISTSVADAAGVRTDIAGPAVIEETITLYGQIAADPERQRDVTARFPGMIHQVSLQLGDTVSAGDTLAVIESNDSLRNYKITAPLAGVVTRRNANVGEETGNRVLFTITDISSVLAELSVFPLNRMQVKPGSAAHIKLATGDDTAESSIQRVALRAEQNQAVIAHAVISNNQGRFLPGSFITADVIVGRRDVPLAVKTSGLQAFRDFTVVYALVGETYEVRMLELGAQNAEWAEVAGGLEPGSRYVTENSYLIKADIEKSAASHDH